MHLDRHRIRFHLGIAALVTAVLPGIAGCPEDARVRGPYLVVGPAAQQSEDDGVIVALQQAGGARLRMRVERGTLAVTSDSTASDRTTACIPTLIDDARFYFTVTPTDAESVLYVDLLPEGPVESPGADADSADLGVTCPGSPLANAVVPIDRTQGAPADGGAGSGGTGGEASTTTSSGAGGAGGTGGGGAGGEGAGGTGTGGTGGGT